MRIRTMSHEPLACDRELLLRSLDDRLSEQQEEQLARHLVECPDCRHELERLAGGQEEWSRVGAALKREADSAQSPARSRPDWISELDEPPGPGADFPSS